MMLVIAELMQLDLKVAVDFTVPDSLHVVFAEYLRVLPHRSRQRLPCLQLLVDLLNHVPEVRVWLLFSQCRKCADKGLPGINHAGELACECLYLVW